VETTTDGRGVVDVYPPALQSMSLGDAPSGDIMLNELSNQQDQPRAIEAVASRALPHPDGFSLSIRRSLIDHPAAGYGVFAEGALVRAGTLVALYPGRLCAPPELSAEVLRDNVYLIAFLSGWVLDGREWHRRGERFEQRLAAVARGGISAPGAADDAMRALLRYRNPLGVANYVNHPPPRAQPNVMCCELELPHTTFDAHQQAWLPTEVAPPAHTLSRLVWHDPDSALTRVMALVALSDISPGSEVYARVELSPRDGHLLNSYT
jgi:hypothetical protein